MGRFFSPLKSANWAMLAASFLACASLACSLSMGAATSANAQNGGYPPGNIPGSRNGGNDSADLLVRIDRLENRVRGMTGQIEQLQFQMRRMQKQLEAFQKDVDFRFNDQSGKKPVPRNSTDRERRGDASQPQDNSPGTSTADAELPPEKQQTTAQTSHAETRATGSQTHSTQSNSTQTNRRDVFNPDANPSAPGAPRQLGSPLNLPSSPLVRGPQDDTNGDRNRQDRNAAERGLPEPDSPIILSRPNLPVTGEPVDRTAGLTAYPLPPADASPKETYRIALAALRKRRYNEAEQGLNDFLKRFPKSTLTPSVRYNLGVVFASRSRHREAAEQFLKVSTDYRKSSRAPDSLYRLGLSLERLGAREQACASYAEVERRYPRASGNLRLRVERQMKMAKC